MRIFKGIHNYLQELSTIKFIITMVVLMHLIIAPFIPLFYLYQKYVGPIGCLWHNRNAEYSCLKVHS